MGTHEAGAPRRVGRVPPAQREPLRHGADRVHRRLPGPRSILAEAGVTNPPILDWFHIAMRLQHAKQAAIGLSTDEPGRMQAKTVIVAAAERLRWRIWNGRAKNAQRSTHLAFIEV